MRTLVSDALTRDRHKPTLLDCRKRSSVCRTSTEARETRCSPCSCNFWAIEIESRSKCVSSRLRPSSLSWRTCRYCWSCITKVVVRVDGHVTGWRTERRTKACACCSSSDAPGSWRELASVAASSASHRIVSLERRVTMTWGLDTCWLRRLRKCETQKLRPGRTIVTRRTRGPQLSPLQAQFQLSQGTREEAGCLWHALQLCTGRVGPPQPRSLGERGLLRAKRAGVHVPLRSPNPTAASTLTAGVSDVCVRDQARWERNGPYSS